ncbi:hypothetical protein C4256_02105 [Clostridioides difficile]|uniref:hypothetical protein n=1 Tax=Clostridioides difficile TaxID=1496 RepID=UPI001A2216A7|nr:hypothetical protein [Clostridioides difficile]MBJ8698911.1 hypothetical protein [Clostridioides difficile]MDB3638990.1 hypothetical protein [Clostridioides difficile]MDE3622935.1 hypothetical protein [Clostridioides difficile]MDS6292482.1 hypothetical protein [Clostridioides difficile]
MSKCPFCGADTFEINKPPKGNFFFLGCYNIKDNLIYTDAGIGVKVFTCSTCHNIQLKAVEQSDVQNI